jgi:simple sugar transport system permease protein
MLATISIGHRPRSSRSSTLVRLGYAVSDAHFDAADPLRSAWRSFHAGLFNIGAEGSDPRGIATGGRRFGTGLPAIIHLPLASSGMIAGRYDVDRRLAQAATRPGVSHHIASSPSAHRLPLRNPPIRGGRTDRSRDRCSPTPGSRSCFRARPVGRIHAGILALVAVVVVYWLLFGHGQLRVRATAPTRTLLVMPACAGLDRCPRDGLCRHRRLAGQPGARRPRPRLPNYSAGIGFDAIAVALLGAASVQRAPRPSVRRAPGRRAADAGGGGISIISRSSRR